MGWIKLGMTGALLTVGLESGAEVRTGAALPALSLPSTSGKKVAVSARGSKALLLIYLRADQQRSAKALQELAALHRRYRGKGVRAMAVTTARHDGRAAAVKLAGKLKLAFPFLVDDKGALRNRGGFIVYPTTVVADGKGVVRYHYSGHREDFTITVERQLRAVLGVGLRPEEIHDVDRNAATAEERKKQRTSRLELMRRRVELKRARRRLEASINVCDEKNLGTVLSIYDRWAALLPGPKDAQLAAAAGQVRAGQARRAVDALRRLDRAGPRPAVWLWLGRALARSGKTTQAEKTLARCAGKATLLGQCEFELARLAAKTDAAKAVKLFQQGHAAAFK